MRGKPKLVRRSDSPFWFIYIPPNDGRRAARLSTGEADYSQAEKVFAQWLLEGRKPELAPLDEIRVIDTLTRYAEYKKDDPTASYHIEKYLKPFFKHYAFSHICNQAIRDYVQHRRESKLTIGKRKVDKSPALATIRRELDTLSAAFGYARKEGYIKEVPYIEKPAASLPRERWLTYEEYGKLLEAAAHNPILVAFIELALNTSARTGAIYQLKWFQVDVENQVIHFNPDGRKQNKKYRPSVTINKGLLILLLALRKKAKNEYVLGGVKNLKKSFKEACERAEITGVTPYTLRHTAVTWAIRAGHSLAQAGAMAGHKDPRTTQRYAKHDPSFTRDITDTLATGVLLAKKMAKNSKKRSKVTNKM